MWKSYTENQPENMNNIGCLFSLIHTVIENDCLLIANDFDHTNPKYVKYRDIRPKDIIKGIRRRFFHTAQLVSHNNIIKYYYQNPIALASHVLSLDTSKDSVTNTIIEFLGYRFVFVMKDQETAKDTYVNQFATRLCGTNRLYGDVLIFNERDEKVLDNISRAELQQLDQLAYGRYDDRALRETENFDEKAREMEEKQTAGSADMPKPSGISDVPDVPDISDVPDTSNIVPSNIPNADGPPVPEKNYWSKHVIRAKRIEELNATPLSCTSCFQTLGRNKEVCKNCYRCRYCSTHCMMKDFRDFHYKECIYHA